MKPSFLILFKIFLVNFLCCMQFDNYKRYDGPVDISSTFKTILIGGAIWAVGMLIIFIHKRNRKEEEKNKNSSFANLGAALCVIGGLIVAICLAGLGF